MAAWLRAPACPAQAGRCQTCAQSPQRRRRWHHPHDGPAFCMGDTSQPEYMPKSAALQHHCKQWPFHSPQDACTAPTHAPCSPGTHCENRLALEPPCLSAWLSQRCKRRAMCRLLRAASHHLTWESTLGEMPGSLHFRHQDCPRESIKAKACTVPDTHPLAEALLWLSCAAGRAACMSDTMFLSSSSSASQSLRRLGHPGLGLQCCGRIRDCCRSSRPLAATTAW